MFYFRLKPSTIPGSGVGVFATADIPRGALLTELFNDDEVRFHSWAEFAALEMPSDIKDNFATRYDAGCYLPADTNRMSVGWYLNHSPEPNLAHDAAYNYHALRDIAAGEELSIDYDDL